MDIIEGNRLIAMFMGMVACTRCTPNCGQYHLEGNAIHWHPSEMKYHTSWDWLMPVVEKIEAMEIGMLEVCFKRLYVQIWNVHPASMFKVAVVPLVGERGKLTKLQATYYCIIDFLTWYNTQNK